MVEESCYPRAADNKTAVLAASNDLLKRQGVRTKQVVKTSELLDFLQKNAGASEAIRFATFAGYSEFSKELVLQLLAQNNKSLHIKKPQQIHRFTITVILLDTGFSGMDFSLKDFCQDIFRTSELMGDEIVKQLLNNR